MSDMTLNDIVRFAHDNAVSKGFYDKPQSIGERLALIHSEISEALEAYRDDDMGLRITESGKPEGFVSELADVVIRVADLAGWIKADLGSAVERKMEYNASRPLLHGRKR